jgi:putative Mg2+ transporter-C (MgtC) family protein
MEIFIQLALAALLGGLIGLERECRRKEAGLRTYALVCLGSALFTIIGFNLPIIDNQTVSLDPTRIIQSVAIGVGFLGGGLIMRRQSRIEGLTTAAGLWVAAGIGVAVGAKLYTWAIFVAVLTVVILFGLLLLERKVFGRKEDEESPE